jgi:hypothetical protein
VLIDTISKDIKMGKIADRFATKRKSNETRAKFVNLCKGAVAYSNTKLDELMANDSYTVDEYLAKTQEIDQHRFNIVALFATKMVREGKMTVAEVKDAAWEGFNGLIEATCVVQNVQHMLGLEVEQVNPADFIIKSPA